MIKLLENLVDRVRRGLAALNHPNVDRRRSFIFIHVPKTAGTSVARRLGLADSRHETAWEYLHLLGPARFWSLLRVAIVRDPIDRYCSLYNYARLPVSHHHDNLDPSRARHGAHADFARLRDVGITESVELLLANRLRHGFPQLTMWAPQADWLVLDDRLAVDFIGRVERLDKDMTVLCQRLGLPAEAMPVINRTEGGATRADLSPESMRLLRRVYARDYELFDYD